MAAFEQAQAKQTTYYYHVDLNERGSYRAHVESYAGKSVFTILDGDELGEDESSIFEDGFMRNEDDMRGLTDYLRDLGVIGKTAHVERYRA